MRLSAMTAIYGFGVVTASLGYLNYNPLFGFIQIIIGTIFIIGGCVLNIFEK